MRAIGECVTNVLGGRAGTSPSATRHTYREPTLTTHTAIELFAKSPTYINRKNEVPTPALSKDEHTPTHICMAGADTHRCHCSRGPCRWAWVSAHRRSLRHPRVCHRHPRTHAAGAPGQERRARARLPAREAGRARLPTIGE